jgi:hypothetical protein
VRRKKLGGDDADGTHKIANTLLDVSRAVVDHSMWEDMKRVNDILKKMNLLIAAENVRETVKKKG